MRFQCRGCAIIAPVSTSDLSRLVLLMERCQRDTLDTLGAGAAGRLANWQRYESDQTALVRFIQ